MTGMGYSPTRSSPRASWTGWSTAPITCSCRARATAPTSAPAPTGPTRHKEVAQARTLPVGVSDSLIAPLVNSRLWCTSRDGNDDSEPRGRRSTCSTSRSWWQHATSRRAESITITRCEPEPNSGILDNGAGGVLRAAQQAGDIGIGGTADVEQQASVVRLRRRLGVDLQTLAEPNPADVFVVNITPVE